MTNKYTVIRDIFVRQIPVKTNFRPSNVVAVSQSRLLLIIFRKSRVYRNQMCKKVSRITVV